MKRFNNDDFSADDEDPEFESFNNEDYTGDENGSIIGHVSQDTLNQWKESEIEQSSHKINDEILKKAILFCKDSWFWRFRTFSSKRHLIAESYRFFSDLIHGS